jgi:DNA-binding transcriptional regulator YdaS (Cro superfamily)
MSKRRTPPADPNNTITRLIELHGRSAFARRLGVSHVATYKWERNRVSAERALHIHREFGIPKWKLRPDLWPRSSR